MKKYLLILLIVTLLFVQTSCAKDDVIIRYDLGSEPKNLDPQTATDIASMTVIHNAFEGLLVLDENGELLNGIAESYTTSSDGLEYNFILNQDAEWSNGDKVTAHDFVFAIQRILTKSTNSPYVNDFMVIKNAKGFYEGSKQEHELGVKAITDTEVRFVLEMPTYSFLPLLASSSAMPCNEKFFTQTKGEYGLEKDTIISNGRFVVSSWKHKNSLKLVKSQKYHNFYKKGTDIISFNLKSDVDKVQRFTEELTDAAYVQAKEYNKISNKGYNIRKSQNTTWGIVFNNANPLLSNDDIRKGIALATDKSVLTKHLPDTLSIANAIIAPSITIQKSNFREKAGLDVSYKYNKSEASQAFNQGLSQLNKTALTDIRILIEESDYVSHSDLFIYLSQIYQRDLGLYISIDTLASDEYQKRIEQGKFDCAIVKLESNGATASSFIDEFYSSNIRNVYSFSNEQFDKYIRDFNLSNSPEEMIILMKKAEQELINKGQFIPLYYESEYFVVGSKPDSIKYNTLNGIVYFK